MPRGRPPKHPKLHALQGTEGALVGFIEATGVPFIPEHLMEDARGCIEIIQQSIPEGVYARLDSFLLAAFAMAWALHKEAALALQEEPAVYTNPETGVKHQSPWVNVLNQQAQVMIAAAGQLGISPMSRARLGTSGAQRQASRFGDLLGGKEPRGLSGSVRTSLSQAESARAAS